MAVEGSLLRKVISDITGLKSSKAIRAGLNMNESYNKYNFLIKKLINLLTGILFLKTKMVLEL